jgi:hypothetical protein
MPMQLGAQLTFERRPVWQWAWYVPKAFVRRVRKDGRPRTWEQFVTAAWFAGWFGTRKLTVR